MSPILNKLIRMNTRSRHDNLVRLLRRGGSTSVAYLSESLETSRRTVLRDIAQLREQGYKIRTTSGPGGGIYLDPSSILVTPKLTSSEVFALLISVAVLKETHSIPFAGLADAGLQKIEQSLPRDRVLELREILASVYIGQLSEPELLGPIDPIHSSVLPAFEQCFLRSKEMRIRYTDRNGRATHRTVHPHAMLVLSPVWYLVGYDPEKSGFRHFRMDRIKKASVMDEAFYRQPFTVTQGEGPFSHFTLNNQQGPTHDPEWVREHDSPTT